MTGNAIPPTEKRDFAKGSAVSPTLPLRRKLQQLLATPLLGCGRPPRWHRRCGNDAIATLEPRLRRWLGCVIGVYLCIMQWKCIYNCNASTNFARFNCKRGYDYYFATVTYCSLFSDAWALASQPLLLSRRRRRRPSWPEGDTECLHPRRSVGPTADASTSAALDATVVDCSLLAKL